MIKETSGWEASDGAFFNTKGAAEKYEKNLHFVNWYADNMLSTEADFGPQDIHVEEIKHWLVTNRLQVLHFLSEGTHTPEEVFGK